MLRIKQRNCLFNNIQYIMNSFGYLQNIILGKMNSPNRRKAC